METGLSRKIIAGFIALIIVGIALLYFFGFNENLGKEPLISSMFTAVSGVCVTGLTVLDVSKEMTLKGQIILLFLIQCGGLGILTLSTWVILFARGRLNLNSALASHDFVGRLYKVNTSKILKMVLLFTFFCETTGALVLFSRFIHGNDLSHAIWLSVFHSVSAFCNAGFSLFSNSLMHFRGDIIINITIMALIMLGGLGFIVVADSIECLGAPFKKRQRNLSVHTKVVLSVSGILILGGFIFFLIFEWGNPVLHESIPKKILEALFTSITARTAGFNTISIEHLTNMSLVMLILLMFVGASPGSTGGGVKTTTVAIIIAMLRGQFLNRPKTEIFSRSIAYPNISKALGVIVLYVGMVLLSMIILQATEFGSLPHDATRGLFLEQLFEVVSALSTVGLSTGITTKLSQSGLTVIMFCMFVGRLGPLVIASSLIGRRKRIPYSYPEGEIMIG